MQQMQRVDFYEIWVKRPEGDAMYDDGDGPSQPEADRLAAALGGTAHSGTVFAP